MVVMVVVLVEVDRGRGRCSRAGGELGVDLVAARVRAQDAVPFVHDRVGQLAHDRRAEHAPLVGGAGGGWRRLPLSLHDAVALVSVRVVVIVTATTAAALTASTRWHVAKARQLEGAGERGRAI